MIIKDDYITKYSSIAKETEKALNIVFDKTKAAEWLPKSQIKVHDAEIKVMTIPHWLAVKKGLSVDPNKPYTREEDRDLKDKWGDYDDEDYYGPMDCDPFGY